LDDAIRLDSQTAEAYDSDPLHLIVPASTLCVP
jgi:hypothetical protein